MKQTGRHHARERRRDPDRVLPGRRRRRPSRTSSPWPRRASTTASTSTGRARLRRAEAADPKGNGTGGPGYTDQGGVQQAEARARNVWPWRAASTRTRRGASSTSRYGDHAPPRRPVHGVRPGGLLGMEHVDRIKQGDTHDLGHHRRKSSRGLVAPRPERLARSTAGGAPARRAADVAVEGDRIVAIGPGLDGRGRARDRRQPGHVVAPGLHRHALALRPLLLRVPVGRVEGAAGRARPRWSGCARSRRRPLRPEQRRDRAGLGGRHRREPSICRWETVRAVPGDAAGAIRPSVNIAHFVGPRRASASRPSGFEARPVSADDLRADAAAARPRRWTPAPSAISTRSRLRAERLLATPPS